MLSRLFVGCYGQPGVYYVQGTKVIVLATGFLIFPELLVLMPDGSLSWIPVSFVAHGKEFFRRHATSEEKGM
jgi:hypothetical protein